MRRCILAALLLLAVSTVLISQDLSFSPSDWEDPAIFEMGQTKPHALHVNGVYAEHNPLREADAPSSYQLLNGSWKFLWLEKPVLVPEDFYLTKFKTKKWNDIQVPSNWQMEGFGHPKFRNIALTFENNPPFIPEYYNPVGLYKRDFNIPATWLNQEIFLRFEGVKSATYIWINGEKVGYNQGGFEPAEFNITPFINKGKNHLAVEVIRFSDGSYLENQDMWRLSGIYRDVILYTLPKVHITDFFHFTDLDSNYKDAELNACVTVSNMSETSKNGYSLEVDIMDADGRSILEKPVVKKIAEMSAGSEQELKLKSEVKDPKLWSAEEPYLYEILYSLKNESGNRIEAFSKFLGFKEVEMKDDVFTVNGVAVKLNGVNSHMHDPASGQAVPYDVHKADLLLMKQHNINCVRTCHYPPSPDYLDLADQLGIYVIAEVGDEAHNNIQLSYDSTFKEMYKDRSRKLVHRDRNHASVIMWSAGNESGSGPNIDEVIKTGKQIDPSRPAWMYGGNTFYIPFEDIIGPRYWTPHQLKNLAEGNILGEDDLRPSFMDEYLAATGNGLGGMDEYWKLIHQYPRLIGGAIWDWISPGIYTDLWQISDGSPAGNDGTIFGRPVFSEGTNGRGLAFSGHDDWIEFYRDPSLDIVGKELSISFWVKANKIPQPNTFLMKGGHQYGIRMSNPDTLEFYVQSNNLEDIHQSPYYDNKSERHHVRANVGADFYNQWHHIAGIYNGSTLELYIDGSMVADRPHNLPISHSPFPLCIGREAETQDQGEYSGRMSLMLIDDVQVSPNAFPIEELKAGLSPEQTVLSLDFENDTKEKNAFFSVGLGGRTYGIIWPDRSVQPEIKQIKKSGQPVAIEAKDLFNGLFKFINRQHFQDLDIYSAEWKIEQEGIATDSGKFILKCLPGQTIEKRIKYPRPKTTKEVILTISLKLKENTSWASRGHEVAWEQFIVQHDLGLKEKLAYRQTSDDLSFEEDEQYILISANEFEYLIDKNKGVLKGIERDGYSYLEATPEFSIWRAPLANDIDPWGSYLYSDKKKTEGLGRSIDNQIRTLGMKEFNVEVDKIEHFISEGKIRISIEKYYQSSNFRGSIEMREDYIFLPSGSVEIEQHIIPHKVLPDMLPRLGWQYTLPKEMNQVKWYGRGPFENYPDRKSGAKLGVYSSDVNKEYVPYIIPQDYGNHSDVRWIELSDNNGHGLRILAPEPINFSFHKYSTENLSRSMYTYQLYESESNFLNLDFEVSGVGGTAIRQLEKYRVKAEEKKYRFLITPF